jgi:outer membrane immunogenic protein
MNNTLVRRFSLAGASLLIIGAASAADLPTRKGPPPAPIVVPPPITWTGFYISAEGGYAWDGSVVYVGPWNKGFNDRGGFGGANVGYNYQYGQFVVGAQASYDFASISGSAFAPPYAVSAKVNGFGSIDGKAGVAWGPWLFYAIGGFAFADVRHTISPDFSFLNYSFSSEQTGWDLGGGVAYKFTQNISVFAEARKYEFGTKSFSDYIFYNNGVKQSLALVRGGVTWNF